MTSCNDGVVTPTTCTLIKTCVPAIPTNGNIGNCPAKMNAGTSCTPGCNTGFFVQGTHKCNTEGVLIFTTCGTTKLFIKFWEKR